MIRILAKCLIILLYALLLACTNSITRQETEVTDVFKNTLINVNVDSDVEDDFNSAIELMQKENFTQAIDVLITVIKREQRLPAPFINIAIAYNKLGDKKLAEENLVEALKLDINHPVANNELGLLYRKSGKFIAARIAYENAIKKHPRYLPVIRNLGVLCDLYLHDFECALEQFENYLALQPEDKTVKIWVADVKRRFD